MKYKNCSILIFTLLLTNFNSYAQNTAVIGEKVFLNVNGPYHFSEKTLVKIFLKTAKPFFIGLKTGKLKYIEHQKEKILFILNKEQNTFFEKTNLIVKENKNLSWDIKNSILILKGKSIEPVFLKFLLKECGKLSGHVVNLHFTPIPKNLSKTETTCLNSLNTSPEKKLQIAIVNSSQIKDARTGLGAPAKLDWLFQSQSGFQTGSLKGQLSAHKGSLLSKSSLLFSGLISVKRPLSFESGSEVGLQLGGLLSRQSIDWQKATTSIKAQLNFTDKNSSEINLVLNKKTRTGESKVFQIEKIDKNFIFENHKWKKAFSFFSEQNENTKRSFLGLSIIGSKHKGFTKNQKEVWIKVGTND